MKKLNGLFVISLAFCLTAPAMGAAFRLRETNANALGYATAGEAAGAENKAPEQFANAATLGFMKKSSVAASLTYLKTSAKFTVMDAKAPTSAGGRSLSGSNGGDGGGNFLIPAAYMAMKLKHHLTFGFGITTPFGLRTDYDRTWVGKSRGIVSDLRVINFNPALAYRVNSFLSVGAGFNIQEAEAELSRNVDLSGGVPGASADATVRGKSHGYGFNVGVLVAPTANTKIGLSWRSAITHELKGDSQYSNRSNTFSDALLNNVKAPLHGQKAKARMTLPDIVILSGTWDVNSSWRLLGSVEWTRWSNLQELRVTFPDSSAKDSVENFSYKDTFFYALGALYKVNKNWTLKMGTAYDITPTSLAHRSPRIPDENRTWLSTGADYRMNERLTLGLNYSYIYVRQTNIDLKTGSANSDDVTKGTLRGHFKSDTHLVGAKLIYRW